jgi:hypothetical protein
MKPVRLASSKLLQRRWQAQDQIKHKEKLKEARSTLHE